MRTVVRVALAEDRPASPQDTFPMDCDEGVFAFDGEGSVRTTVPFEQSAAAAFEAIRELEGLLEPASDAEAMLARHVELAAGGAHRVDPAYLAAVLQRLGYSAKLHESSAALAKFKRGVRHQFITVPLPDAGLTGLATYIVDPNFRDSLTVAHPTPRYAAVLDALPSAVVASKACLHRAVTLISREMSASFLDQGEDLPPWRTPQALLSKWQLGGAVMSSTAGGAGCSAWATQGRPAGFALGAGGLFGDAKRAPGAD